MKMTERRRRSRDKRVGDIAHWLLPSIGSFAALILLYLLIFNGWRFLLDSDTGWHIRTGELILQTGSIPRVDPFSHTMSGRQWFAWEWLADVLMATAHRWRGLAGIVGGSILILLISYTALFHIMLRRGSDPIIAFVATIFAALCCIVHWLARPHLFSIALIVAWYALVESYRRSRKPWIYFVPLVIAFWANLHGAFIVTFAVLAVYAAGDAIETSASPGKGKQEAIKALKTYAIVGALSAIAALVTPYGLKLYGHIGRYLTDKQLIASIQEFQSPNFHGTDGKLIELLLLFGVIAAVNAIREGRFVETGLLLLWAHLTLQSERHVTLAAVTLTPVIAEQLSRLASEVIERLTSGGEIWSKTLRAMRDWYRETIGIDRQLTGAFVYGAALVFVIALTAGSLPGKLEGKLLFPRFDPGRFPVNAAAFIEKTKPDGNLFAHDQFGGYLIYRLYPGYKVFVDGRSDFYRQGTVLNDTDGIIQVKPQWSELLDKYGVNLMILQPGEPLDTVARMSGKWKSIFEDSTAQVLIRNYSLPGTVRPVENK